MNTDLTHISDNLDVLDNQISIQFFCPWPVFAYLAFLRLFFIPSTFENPSYLPPPCRVMIFGPRPSLEFSSFYSHFFKPFSHFCIVRYQCISYHHSFPKLLYIHDKLGFDGCVVLSVVSHKFLNYTVSLFPCSSVFPSFVAVHCK